MAAEHAWLLAVPRGRPRLILSPMQVSGRIRVATAAVALTGVLLVAPGSAAASPYVHAHRGGSLATQDREQRPSSARRPCRHSAIRHGAGSSSSSTRSSPPTG